MYEMKNLNHNQLNYLASVLARKSIYINRIGVSGHTLYLDRNLSKTEGDSVLVDVHHDLYYASYYPRDPQNVQATDISVSKTIIGAILDQFRQINAIRVQSLLENA